MYAHNGRMAENAVVAAAHEKVCTFQDAVPRGRRKQHFLADESSDCQLTMTNQGRALARGIEILAANAEHPRERQIFRERDESSFVVQPPQTVPCPGNQAVVHLSADHGARSHHEQRVGGQAIAHVRLPLGNTEHGLLGAIQAPPVRAQRPEGDGLGRRGDRFRNRVRHTPVASRRDSFG